MLKGSADRKNSCWSCTTHSSVHFVVSVVIDFISADKLTNKDDASVIVEHVSAFSALSFLRKLKNKYRPLHQSLRIKTEDYLEGKILSALLGLY